MIQIRSVLVNSSKYPLNKELSADRRAGRGIPARGNTPCGQILSLFASSNPDQRTGILNQLLSAVGPGTGLCDRGWLRRGGRCDPDRRAGPPRRDPGDRHARVLRPAW